MTIWCVRNNQYAKNVKQVEYARATPQRKSHA